MTESRGELRVAVCISGQLRGFREAAPSLLKHIIDPLGADVFVHTWSDRGISNSAQKRVFPHPMRSYLTVQKDLEILAKDLPSVHAAYFGDRMRVTPDEVRAVYGDAAVVQIEDYPEDEAAFFDAMPPARLLELEPRSKWSVPMTYKIWAANELKRERERSEGFTYDLVIRIRPDLVIGDDFTAGRRDTPGVVFHRVRKVDPGSQLGDQLFFGDSATMDAVCGLYARLDDIYSTLPSEPTRAQLTGYWAEGLLHGWVDQYTDVTPQDFRTEPYNAPSDYRLADPVIEKVPFEHFFSRIRPDLLRAPGDPHLEAVREGCSRALFHFVIGAKGDAVQAARTIADAAERDGLFDARFGRAGIAYKERRYAAAAKLFAAIQADEHTALPSYWLGRARFALGDFAEALAAFDESIAAPLEYESQRPSQKAPAFLWRGRALELLGRPEEAAASYATAAGLNPESFDTLHRFGGVLGALGRHHHASAVLQQAVALDPDNLEVRHLLARSMTEIGVNRPVVRDLWTQPVNELAERFPTVLPVLARAHLALGREDRARMALEAIPVRARIRNVDRVTAAAVAEAISPELAASVRKRIGSPASPDAAAPSTARPATRRSLRAVAIRLAAPVRGLLRH